MAIAGRLGNDIYRPLCGKTANKAFNPAVVGGTCILLSTGCTRGYSYLAPLGLFVIIPIIPTKNTNQTSTDCTHGYSYLAPLGLFVITPIILTKITNQTSTGCTHRYSYSAPLGLFLVFFIPSKPFLPIIPLKPIQTFQTHKTQLTT